MPKIIDMYNEIIDPILADYVGSLKGKGVERFFQLDRSEVAEELGEATPRMEREGIGEYALKFEFYLKPRLMNPEEYKEVSEPLLKLSGDVLNEVKFVGIRVPENWDMRVNRFPGIGGYLTNEFVICPCNNYNLFVDLKAVYNGGKKHDIATMGLGGFPLHGCVAAIKLKYNKKMERFQISNDPFILNLDDRVSEPHEQLLGGVAQHCLGGIINNLLKTQSEGSLTEYIKYANKILESFGSLIDVLVDVKKKNSLEMKQKLVNAFYQNPLIFLNKNPEKAAESY